jgi:hypothetical protein
VIVATAALALALTGCVPHSPDVVATIDRIEFSHGADPQADDDDVYVQEDPQEVAAFVDLLQKYAIDPGAYGMRERPDCPDDETTRVEVSYGDTQYSAGFIIGACAAQDDTFEADAFAMLDRWFDEVSPGRVP